MPMNNAGAVAPAVVSGAVTIGGLTVRRWPSRARRASRSRSSLPFDLFERRADVRIIVLKNSPLRKAADLNGKTLARAISRT